MSSPLSLSPLSLSFLLSLSVLTSLLERRQPSDVVPEVGGLALGLGQHEDLLLGHSRGQRRVLLAQQEVVVGPGHR